MVSVRAGVWFMIGFPIRVSIPYGSHPMKIKRCSGSIVALLEGSRLVLLRSLFYASDPTLLPNHSPNANASA